MHTYLCLNYCWLFGTGTQVPVHQKAIQGKRYRVHTQVLPEMWMKHNLIDLPGTLSDIFSLTFYLFTFF